MVEAASEGEMDVREAAIVLGVAEGAEIEAVRRAYRSHARLLHPDRFAGASHSDRSTAHLAMARLNEAYEVLINRARDDVPSIAKGPQKVKSPRSSTYRSSASGDVIERFDALLSHPRGWDLNGTLQVINIGQSRPLGRFLSDDVDARGTPIIDEEVKLDPYGRTSRHGSLNLLGGGYLVILGGQSNAERVRAYLTGAAKPRVSSRESNVRAQWIMAAGIGVLALGVGVLFAATWQGDEVDAPTTVADWSSRLEQKGSEAAPTKAPSDAKVANARGEESPVAYAVGDTGPGGGTIFYAAEAPQAWGRYLEAAPSGWSDGSNPKELWCKSLPDIETGSSIGDGAQNTSAIADACPGPSAAEVAASYRGGGFSDWYLPSRDELIALLQSEEPCEELSFLYCYSNRYWSSSLWREALVYTYYTSTEGGSLGTENFQDEPFGKGRARFGVRPIRAFG